ncbi:beta-phosphoglucomutase [Danxiaibacter flavus]|uniref:Beta-phosphoglucomutase n=1 Tax=Danxiaibacter flavus TaxID=3049108 RepID=A0ABV3ZGP8_9BACT|nr:beta-phosphoglucomutase [Chitinophagaceae bacterium DXS]
MGNTITTCIFDLDGVIVDTAVYHYKAWRQMANELGFDFSELQNEKLKGVSRIDSLRLILSWGNVVKEEEEIQVLAKHKNDAYLAMIEQMTPENLLPGAHDFLVAAKEKGYKVVLGSASKNAKLILDKTGVLPLFDAIVDGNIVTASKPDPQVFLKGAELVNERPQHCVVFEDAEAGIEAAKRAGMHTVGIGSAEILHGADILVSGLNKITIADIQSI